MFPFKIQAAALALQPSVSESATNEDIKFPEVVIEDKSLSESSTSNDSSDTRSATLSSSHSESSSIDENDPYMISADQVVEELLKEANVETPVETPATKTRFKMVAMKKAPSWLPKRAPSIVTPPGATSLKTCLMSLMTFLRRLKRLLHLQLQ